MHSRIFQIETSPVDESEFITENDYIGDHWFVYSVADYVVPDENRSVSIEWFKETLSAGSAYVEYFADEDGEGFILHEGFVTAYFENEFKGFTAALQSLAAQATSDAFANGKLSVAMINLETAYDDKFGFYIDCDETGLVTLNRFLRCSQPEVRYYFGGTVDYHC